ncbi:MAG: SigE family RNA polymerase sigma factor [Nocardioides sp.]
MRLVTGVWTRGRLEASDKDAQFTDYMAARRPRLLRAAYLLTADRHLAEDLVQTTLAKLYLSWDDVRSRELLDGYVWRILLNQHRSFWRKAWRRKEISTDEVPDHGVEAVEPDEVVTALWALVKTLPNRQRAVIVLRYYEQLTEAETAEILGVSVGTVKSQTNRALASLRARASSFPALAREELT